MNVAIIPARGGSKRIPRKNVRLFDGRPIIAYSIEAALGARCFERVIVSTDDAEVAALAREHGAETPFVRPASLADDRAGTMEVIRHALDYLETAGEAVGFVCCIYPTAPFLEPDDLLRGLATLEAHGADYAFGVTSYAYPVQRALRLDGVGRVWMLDEQQRLARSQDLEPAYHDAGQFYWGRAEAFAEGRPVLSPASVGVVLPRYRTMDIDTPEDWEHAERLFLARKPAT